MGFQVGYIYLPKLLTYTLCLLEIVKELIFYILRFLGVSHFLEPESLSHTEEHHAPTSTEPPLSAVLIRELLPAVKFSGMLSGAHGSRDGEQPSKCAVCLYEFRGDEEIRILKNCQHIFHKNCIDCWMDHDRRTCPLCRKSLVPVDLQNEYNHRLWAASCSDYDLYGADYEVPIFY